MSQPTITLRSGVEDPWPWTIDLEQATLAVENFEAIKDWFWREKLKRHPAEHLETRF